MEEAKQEKKKKKKKKEKRKMELETKRALRFELPEKIAARADPDARRGSSDKSSRAAAADLRRPPPPNTRFLRRVRLAHKRLEEANCELQIRVSIWRE